MGASERWIEVDIRSYWHAGTGRGGGEDADALTERDGDGLPYLPGRHLKGLLRDACIRLEGWEALEHGTTDLLFGIDPQERSELIRMSVLEGTASRQAAAAEMSRHDTLPGCLAIGNAILPEQLRAPLKTHPMDRSAEVARKALRRRTLFTFITATAIEDTGVAKSDTLRRIEVTIPLRLRAAVRWAPEARQLQATDEERERVTHEAARWPARLKSLLPLVRAVGAHRTRRYGRARLALVGAAS